MLLKQAEQVGRVLVYYDVLAGDVDAKAVRSEVFSVLKELDQHYKRNDSHRQSLPFPVTC